MHTQLAPGVEQEDKGAAANQPAVAQVGPDEVAERVVMFVNPLDQFSIGGYPVGGLLLSRVHHQP